MAIARARRRQRGAAGTASPAPAPAVAGEARGDDPDRLRGLLTGTLVGDALGGPAEFRYPPQRSAIALDTAALTPARIGRLGAALALLPYPGERQAFGAWRDAAPAGTVTDDSRLKLIYANSLDRRGRSSERRMARALLDFPTAVAPAFDSLAAAWLAECVPSALWTLGRRNDPRAEPVDALWAGVPTNLGQMAFLPAAALHPAAPEAAYRAAWVADYFDQGQARDLHAATVAALSHALADTATWAGVWAAAIATDPFSLDNIPWARRRTTYWIDFARAAARRSEGVPAELFRILESDAQAIQWWDAWVPLVVAIAVGELTDYEPRAWLQLAIAFGHDTDSYCQLIGAFAGAMYGEDVWPAAWREAVYARLEADYGVGREEWFGYWDVDP